MKRKKLVWILPIALLVLAGALTAAFLLPRGEAKVTGGDTIADGRYLLTIDGYGVTEEEFRLFLGDQRAITANYFWTQYQVQPDADFWTTEFSGETPLGYAKQRALDALVRSKMQFILAAERNLLDYQDYDGILADMEAENAERARKQETGEVFYGLTEFSPFTYYQYLNTNLRSELEYSQQELSQPTEDDLRRVYEENLSMFDLGTVYDYEAVFPDGTRESVSQSSLEVGKEDSTTEILLELFETMEPGTVIPSFEYHGQEADIIFLSSTHQGTLSFEEAEDSLRVLYSRSELSQLIASRAEAADIRIDRARFDAITME